MERAAIYFRRIEKEGTDSEAVSVKDGSPFPPYEVAVHLPRLRRQPQTVTIPYKWIDSKLIVCNFITVKCGTCAPRGEALKKENWRVFIIFSVMIFILFPRI